MAKFLAATGPYLLIGLIVYLIFRALIWLLYYKGEMRVPVLHEVLFAVLAIWYLALFASSVTPALGFSLKPSLAWTDLIPLKGMIDLATDEGFSAVVGAMAKYIPLGLLIPFLFRRYRNFLKGLMLCSGTAVVIELFQLFLTEADPRLDDVLLALLGTFIGYFLFGLASMYYRELERMATVKRSRRRGVPIPVRRELELLMVLMLAVVLLRGGQLEHARVQQVKAQEAARAAEAAAQAAAEAEAAAQAAAEAEAKKLKAADTLLEAEVEASSAILFSIDSDQILYEKNSTEQISPASTAKLLTALTVLDYCSVSDSMTAGEEISLASTSGSSASLKSGTSGTVETFLGAMLVPSGNDAAYALANYVGKKILNNDSATVTEAVAAFVDAMNSKAEALDLENSHFETPDGDGTENQYTTAQDMVRIARACLQNETIMKLCGARSYRALFDNMDVTYQTTNSLLQTSGGYYNANVTGLKTGTLSGSNVYNLVASATIDGQTYVAVILSGTDTGRYTDANTLFGLVSSGDDGTDTTE